MTARANNITPTMIPVFCWEFNAGAGAGGAAVVAVTVAAGAEVGVMLRLKAEGSTQPNWQPY